MKTPTVTSSKELLYNEVALSAEALRTVSGGTDFAPLGGIYVPQVGRNFPSTEV